MHFLKQKKIISRILRLREILLLMILLDLKIRIHLNQKNILFLSEPVSIEDRKYYTELKCIKYFMKNLEKLRFKFNKIQIRPHPSENLSKFSKIKKLSSKIYHIKKE